MDMAAESQKENYASHNCYLAGISSQAKTMPQTLYLVFSICLLCCHDANMNSEICVGQVAGTLTVKKSIIRALISCIDQG